MKTEPELLLRIIECDHKLNHAKQTKIKKFHEACRDMMSDLSTEIIFYIITPNFKMFCVLFFSPGNSFKITLGFLRIRKWSLTN